MFNNNFNSLCNVRFVEFNKTCDLSFCLNRFATRVFFNLFVNLIEGFIFRKVLQHVKNKTFLDCLFHRIDMESFPLTFCIYFSKELQSGRFWRGGKCKNRNIRLLAITGDFVNYNIFGIKRTFRIDISFSCPKCHCNSGHIFARSRRMRFVNNYRKFFLFQSRHAINDIGELLNCRSNYFSVSFQSDCKVGRGAFVIHYADKPRFMFYTKNSRLQLSVNNYPVGNHNNIIVYNFIIGVM